MVGWGVHGWWLVFFFFFLFWIDGFEREEREGGKSVVVVVVVVDRLDVYTIWIKPCLILQYYGSPWLSGMMADAIGTFPVSPHAAGCCD